VAEADTRPTISAVIPLYREGAHLLESIGEILGVLRDTGESFELLLVDDGSPDDTWERIVELGEGAAEVRGIRLSRNFGKEAALAAGLEHAKGKAIVVMDGDLQHPPALIPEMIEQWRAGADVVEGVKQSRGKERLSSNVRARLFYYLFSRLTGLDLYGASDFKLMDRRVLEAWSEFGERNLFFRGMHAWLGFRRARIPFDVADRAGGETGWSLLQLVKLALTAVTSFSSAPLYILIFVGIGFAALALPLGVQAVYYKLTGQAVSGFTTVILLILILGSAVMFGLGLIGVYVARIYDEVKHRPRYIIADQVTHRDV
jgi:glycosyltransferase involved in cell wall biosynthesis